MIFIRNNHNRKLHVTAGWHFTVMRTWKYKYICSIGSWLIFAHSLAHWRSRYWGCWLLFTFPPLSFSLLLQIPFTYLGDFSLSVCVCVCLEAYQSPGAGEACTVAVTQRWLFINLPPSLSFSPLPFLFPVCSPHPPLLLITRRAGLMSKHYQRQPLCPLTMTMPPFFLLIGRLCNCDRWLLLQRGLQCTANS